MAKYIIDKIKFTADLRVALKNADLMIEAIPENIQIKREFYNTISKIAENKTIFVTNSSTFIPSQLITSVDRPEKLLALHFANQIWINNTAAIMGHSLTNKNVIADVAKFAKAIQMVTFILKKEHPGYILNSLLVPFLYVAESLWAERVANPVTIDKAWIMATKSPIGPLDILDIVGLNSPYNLALSQENQTALNKKITDSLKQMIDNNKVGVTSGEGFYKYPNPEYQSKQFTIN